MAKLEKAVEDLKKQLAAKAAALRYSRCPVMPTNNLLRAFATFVNLLSVTRSNAELA